ncbi:hypothetical protein Tco_0549290 [Tanacetum coccineum]
MFVDHMSQPWRTLVAIINKCLSRNTASNDKLRKSRIDIMMGMFYRENVDYPKLIWEDFAYQINHIKEKKSRRENMPFPSIHQREEYQEYEFVILDVMLNDTIKQSESYQMFIKYSTESKHEPQFAKKKTTSRRVVKKKVIISADDNIIPNPKTSFELGKSNSSTEAAEKEAARQVHAIHARIMTEYVPKSARRRSSGISIRETSQGRQQGTRGLSKGTGRHQGVPDESTVVSATSSEGTGTKPGVPDEEKDDIDGDANDEGDDHISDIQDVDDVDMAEPETIKHENKEKDDMTDATKPDTKKSAEEKGDAEKAKKATGSNYQVKESTEFPLPSSKADVSSLMDIPIQQETPQIQSPSVQKVPQRVAKLEKDMSKLKNINLFAETLGTLKSQVPTVVDDYLGSKLALTEDENAIDKGVADTVKDHKRKHDDDNDDDDEDPPAGPN